MDTSASCAGVAGSSAGEVMACVVVIESPQAVCEVACESVRCIHRLGQRAN